MSNGAARSKATDTVAGREPMTLQQAHEVLRRQRPPVSASAAKWRAFHEKAAQLYSSVAALDDVHHFEALAFAGIARDDAEKFSTETADSAAAGAKEPEW